MAHALGVLLAIQSLVTGAPDTGVTGVTRALEDGRPLAGVVVQDLERARWTVSDTAGRYRIVGLAPGPCRLRFRAPGRVTLEVTALIPPSLVRLDVGLTQTPVELPPLLVVAHDSAGSSQAEEGAPASGWSLRAIPGFDDLRSSLAVSPEVSLRGGGAGTLHLRGGAASEVLFTLDGFPIYAASHFAGAWSAVNPDAVTSVAVTGDELGPADDDRLSGGVAMRTSLLGGDSVHARGGLNPSDIRQLVRGGLGPGGGRFLLSGRRSFRNFFVAGTEVDGSNGYDDWLGTVVIPLAGGRLRALSFRTGNQLAFESRADTLAEQEGTSALNNLEWGGRTDGVAWEREVGRGDVGLMAWRAGSTATVDWLDPRAPVGLESRFVELGVRGHATAPAPRGSLTLGVGLRHLRTDYVTPQVEISTRPTLLQASVQRRWSWHDVATVDLGLRAVHATFGWTGWEPRVSARLRPAADLLVTASAERAFQFTQSLRNEETFLSTLTGMEAPSAVGAAGVPIASADNLRLGVTWTAGGQLTLGVDGYARRMSGLLLAAPASSHPFATGLVGIGTGNAAGVGVHARYARGPLELGVAVGLARASRSLAGMTYTPGFVQARALNAVAIVHPDRLTALGLALTAATGQPTTPVTGVDWRPDSPLGSEGELAGTPANAGSTVNGHRLPGFQRVDLGVRRDWRLLNISATVENLLDHANALGILRTAGTPAQILRARGCAFSVAAGWAF